MCSSSIRYFSLLRKHGEKLKPYVKHIFYRTRREKGKNEILNIKCVLYVNKRKKDKKKNCFCFIFCESTLSPVAKCVFAPSFYGMLFYFQSNYAVTSKTNAKACSKRTLNRKLRLKTHVATSLIALNLIKRLQL
jgi:hypothetical protein